jgi:hypothetical protein
MARQSFYRPTDEGAEAALRQKLERFARLRRKRAAAR